jgi:hypothetical protein
MLLCNLTADSPRERLQLFSQFRTWKTVPACLDGAPGRIAVLIALFAVATALSLWRVLPDRAKRNLEDLCSESCSCIPN